MVEIKSKERVKDYGEVYTPDWIVKDMCNLIPLWDNLDATFLEPACGNGNFLVEILQRKLKLCKTSGDVTRAVQSIYGVDILADNVKESKERMFKTIFDSGLPFNSVELLLVMNLNVQQGNFLTQRKENGDRILYCDWKNGEMKTIEPNEEYIKKLNKRKNSDVNNLPLLEGL